MPGNEASPGGAGSDVLQIGRWIMTVCNACRYCEGFCPVFPAMEHRLTFSRGDLTYLANLCHNCGECLYACQYAPPHDFGINVPRTLAQIRLRSYEDACWPRAIAAAFRGHGLLAAVSVPLAATAALLIYALTSGPEHLWGGPPADFYRIVPHAFMVGLFGAAAICSAIALTVGLVRFLRVMDATTVHPTVGFGEAGERSRSARVRRHLAALARALREAGTLRHLRSQGMDCVEAELGRSTGRRWFHHLTVYGFALCLGSTSVAALYHTGFGWRAPYAYTSLPVVLGEAGGIGLIVGPLGLWRLRRRRDPALGDTAQHGLDVSFLWLLVLTSLTGLVLLAGRQRAMMGVLLLIHLAVVLVLLLALPYGKFVHGIYRVAALYRYALEQDADRDRARTGKGGAAC
jgi:citrate/tricarballylate utilization protein